ncbi:MAG: class I SAM-dependent methyltransferase [Acidobacteriota bacterium]
MGSRASTPFTIDQLLEGAVFAESEANELKSRLKTDDFEWYRYSILGSVEQICQLLQGDFQDLSNIVTGPQVADIGGADGDLSFFLERYGLDVDLIDNSETNINGMKAARLIKKTINSKVNIYEIDLNQPFELPRSRYDLIFMLGTLYHMQNPFYVLDKLSWHTYFCFLSTRVTRCASDPKLVIKNEPVAYLVDVDELNQDCTNYWIFTETGLRRILSRTGWVICGLRTYGDTERSDPISVEHDERAFCLLKSKRISPSVLGPGWEPAAGNLGHWMGPVSETQLISGSQGRLSLRGYVPELVFNRCYNGEATLQVKVTNGRETVHKIGGSGTFTVEVPVSACKKLTVHLKMNKSFIPDELDSSGDTRTLSAIFTEIEAY